MSLNESTVPDQSKKTEKKKWGNWPKQGERLSAESERSDLSVSPKSGNSKLELELARQLKLAGIHFLQEVSPIPGRKFRFDFALKNLLIECNGQTWTIGGHSSGSGLARDYEKAILAQLNGWRVFSFDKEMIFSGKALQWIQQALNPNP